MFDNNSDIAVAGDVARLAVAEYRQSVSRWWVHLEYRVFGQYRVLIALASFTR